ncbi:MAG TPA: 50S ribosomal protein L33 [Acholeplasma sp.]|jgi:large subunit ribosomal protein L33|nr:50S ribosomal protein L33 [Acholeplasma sp.]
MEVDDMRTYVKLVCTECNEENYYTDKNKRTTPDRLEMKKYCPKQRKHTLHREKR